MTTPTPGELTAKIATLHRALTSPPSSDYEDAMTFHDAGVASPMPGSPPDLTGSKSSKSSSFHSSYQSDDNSILTDTGNFEDIGLDDESRAEAEIGGFVEKTSLHPYDASFATDLRATAKQRKRVPMSTTNGNRAQRELTAKSRPPYPHLGRQVRSATTTGIGLGLLPINNSIKSNVTTPNGTTMVARGFASPSTPNLPMMKRHRSTSPLPGGNKHGLSAGQLRVRRGSWQNNTQRKTAKELEKECDEDDGDDVPEDCFLENIPISPRPPSERALSRPASASTSPERPPKDRVRSVGNGTSPFPAEQGELRSPKSPITRTVSMGQFPMGHELKGRAKSWTVALAGLSPEAKALTEALEAHAEDEESKPQDPRSRRSFGNSPRTNFDKPARIRSAIAELPPLRRTDMMIDPLPISKEKEAVLSRTRPSWLPPKDPAEEKRHLKEYQRMMALSLEADRKREAEQQAKSTCKDDTASSLLRIWEEHVLPNWDDVVRQKRTRELWWRGIAPRSRGKVWTKAIGNELGLTNTSYTAALRRAQALEKTIKAGSQLSADEERKKGWLDKIESDVKSTYPELKIFQPEGPLHEALLNVLKSYAMYRSDVGYVTGTSTIAAILLLNLDTPSASFQALANVLNRSLPLAFHTYDTGAIQRTYALLLTTLQHKSPRLHKLLTDSEINPRTDAYLRDMFASLFTGYLSLDNATRLWDVMVFEGDAVLVRAGVAYLTAMEGKLFGAGSAKDLCKVVLGGLKDVSEEKWMGEVRRAGKS